MSDLGVETRSAAEPATGPARRDRWLLVAAAAMLFTVALGARDLWNPNEPLYGRAAVEMAEAGSWLVPTVNGDTFAEKPILYYWLARIAATIGGGADELTLRLPSALAGIVSVALLHALVLPYAGRRRAALAALLLMTQYQMWWASRAIQMDILVLVTTLGALVPLSRMLDHGLKQRTAWLLAGLSCGIGFTAKGPVAIVVPSLAFLAYALGDRRPLRTWLPGLAWAVPTALLAGSPWYVALWAADRGDVLYEAFVRQNFVRFVEAWDHVKPWWYYLQYVWLEFFPWSWFAALALALRPDNEPERRLHRLAWSWAVAVLVFFSLSDSKRAPYILPVAPAAAVLAAAVLDRAGGGRLAGGRRLGFAAVSGLLSALFALLGGALLVVAPGHLEDVPEAVTPAAILGIVLVSTAAAVAVGTALRRRRPQLAPTALIAGMTLTLLVAGALVLPAANRLKSMREFMGEVLAYAGDDAKLATFDVPHVHAGYAFYAARDVPDLDEAGLGELCSRPDRPDIVVVEPSGMEAFHAHFADATAAVEQRRTRREARAFDSRDLCGGGR